MSSDPRDYYRANRHNELPPLREVVGDALDSPARSPYHRFDFDDVTRALPGSSKHDRYAYSSQYLPERGPTLAPIRQFSAREPSVPRGASPAPPSGRTQRRERSHDAIDSNSKAYIYSTPTLPQPATGPASYSYNVLRTQQGDLVDVRTPSSRAQGILRPTAIIEDEDDSHKRYKCDWPDCDKKYDRPSSLEVHRHTHTGSQPYPCQYPGCNRAFNVKSNMLRHFRSHPQQKPPRKPGSGKQKPGDTIANDTSDGEDDDDKWPETSPSRYFHHTSSAEFRPPSSQGYSSFNSPSSSSQQYYTSSHRR